MNIVDLQKKYKLSKNDFWEVRGGNWVIKHDAVERIANQEKIKFLQPDVYTENGTVAMLGVASKPKGETLWSTGEASADNVKGQGKYYWAMAEKRLKDRLTLKLINAYEYGIYSDTESDDFKQIKKKSISQQVASNIPFTEQCDLAKKKQLICADCASEIIYYELKTGEARLKCPQNWKHKNYRSRADQKKEVEKLTKPF